MRPKTGSWFPPPSFREVLWQRGLRWDREALEKALAVGEEYLDEAHFTPLADEVAERPIWLRYYQLVLEELGINGDCVELAEAITQAWERAPSVEPYPWTVPTLAQLRQRQVRVVILADAWPSLRRWYAELGLAGYIDGMVISAEEGRTKPDPLVFAKARSLLGPHVSDVVFVDDYPGHVCAAAELGVSAVRLRHPEAEADPTVQEITDLRELLALLPERPSAV